MRNLLCIGMGFTARALAAKLSPRDWRIVGTSRSLDGVERIRASGFDAIRFDGNVASSELRDRLRSTTHLLVSAAPDASGDPLLVTHATDLATAPRLRWIGYLSTIGVYGDHQGDWIDEGSPTSPQTERGVRRLAAEQAWRELSSAPDRCLQIFRLAGIYGPGRSAIDNIRTGKARRIVKPGQVFNRIHVDDIALVLLAGLAGRGASATYNVADDEPAPPQDVIAYAAKLMGAAVPPAIAFDDADMTEMARSFYSDRKRVRNDPLKRAFGITLAHPTYREGLRAIAATRS